MVLTEKEVQESQNEEVEAKETFQQPIKKEKENTSEQKLPKESQVP